jgi:hypothetical protein
MEAIMVYLVYSAQGAIAFVCHELLELFRYMGSNNYYKIEVWNKGRHVGGTYG